MNKTEGYKDVQVGDTVEVVRKTTGVVDTILGSGMWVRSSDGDRTLCPRQSERSEYSVRLISRPNPEWWPIQQGDVVRYQNKVVLHALVHSLYDGEGVHHFYIASIKDPHEFELLLRESSINEKL